MNLAHHVRGDLWFVLPSLPLLLDKPGRSVSGPNFWAAHIAGCLLTIILYRMMTWLGSRFGLRQ